MQNFSRITGKRTAWVVAGLLALLAVSVVAAVVLVGSDAGEAPADPRVSRELRSAVTPGGILDHARRFQAIADANGGNRAAGTPGYDASAEYVADELRRAGYDVTVQTFEFPGSAAVREADVELPGARETAGFAPMEGSDAGEVEARLRPVDARSATSGCEAEDFVDFPEGDVALVRRGTCTFETKARHAEEAGASAVVVSNAGEDEGEVLRGSLGGDRAGIPVIGATAGFGEAAIAREDAPEVRVSVGERGNNRTTNVIAQTRGGEEDETVMVGAHLDSVAEGPGINDNGSGAATVLEIALHLSELDAEPRNRVRFAFWGAEELGLVGSRHYVEGLDEGEIDDISVYLNFDMVGSPNPVRSIYEGPDEVEDVFDAYFEAQGIEAETDSALDGRSDHGPFQEEGVPTGGLFSGAGGTKSRGQQEAFGGEAGEPFDPCYHRACDDVSNLDKESLDLLSDAAAHATAVLAQRKGS